MEHQDIDKFFRGERAPLTFEELLVIATESSKRQTHGYRDNDVYENGRLSKDNSSIRRKHLLDGTLVCHCRYISHTMVDLFNDVGIPARLTEWVSGNKDNHDTRHTTFEILWENKFIHVDVDMGVLFKHEQFLSSFELKKAFENNNITASSIVRLSREKKVSPNFPHREHIIRMLEEDNVLLDWYKHLTDSLLIGTDLFLGTSSEEKTDNIWHHMIESKKDKARIVDEIEFVGRNYSEFQIEL